MSLLTSFTRMCPNISVTYSSVLNLHQVPGFYIRGCHLNYMIPPSSTLIIFLGLVFYIWGCHLSYMIPQSSTFIIFLGLVFISKVVIQYQIINKYAHTPHTGCHFWLSLKYVYPTSEKVIAQSTMLAHLDHSFKQCAISMMTYNY